MFASIKHWIPPLIMMAVIFLFSSRPANELPYFDWADQLVKKSGHAIGYGLLAYSYLRALGENKNRYRLAWIFSILYAITDEIHQKFVPGRHPSPLDVLLFDNLGALIALTLSYFYLRRSEISRVQSQVPLRDDKTSNSK